MWFPWNINGSIMINSLHLKAFKKRFFALAWAFITAAHLFRSEQNTIQSIIAFFTHVQSNYSWRFFIYCSSFTLNWCHVTQLILSCIGSTGGQELRKAIQVLKDPLEQKKTSKVQKPLKQNNGHQGRYAFLYNIYFQYKKKHVAQQLIKRYSRLHNPDCYCI